MGRAFSVTKKIPTFINLETKDGKILRIKAIKTTMLPQRCIVIKGLRVRECLTQKQLAKLLGISPSTLSRIETDKKKIDLKMAKKLSKVLKTGLIMFYKEEVI